MKESGHRRTEFTQLEGSRNCPTKTTFKATKVYRKRVLNYAGLDKRFEILRMYERTDFIFHTIRKENRI